MSNEIMKAENLSVDYGQVRAVSSVSLTIHEGETLGLVGESGCGKSSLGRSLIGLEPIASGRLEFRGMPVAGQSPRQMRDFWADVQMIFQDPHGSLNRYRRIADIVADPARFNRGMPRTQARQLAEDLLGRVGLPNMGNRRPDEFSGGQRQRIGIARALSSSPRLIIADEPVSALDVSVQAQVLNLMKALKDENQLTFIFISHDLSVVRLMADRVAVMYLGQIVEIADNHRFFATQMHPYSEALISSVPNFGNFAQRERIVLEGDLPSPRKPPKGCRFSTRCRYVAPRCLVEEPMLREIEPGRNVRCHFPIVTNNPGRSDKKIAL